VQKTINTDKSAKLSGSQVERRATLKWKTSRNELLFLRALGFLKRTFPTSSYWQRHKCKKYFLLQNNVLQRRPEKEHKIYSENLKSKPCGDSWKNTADGG